MKRNHYPRFTAARKHIKILREEKQPFRVERRGGLHRCRLNAKHQQKGQAITHGEKNTQGPCYFSLVNFCGRCITRFQPKRRQHAARPRRSVLNQDGPLLSCHQRRVENILYLLFFNRVSDSWFWSCSLMENSNLMDNSLKLR